MESAGDISDVNEREQLFIWTAFQVAEAFAEVDVEKSFVLDGAHGCMLTIRLGWVVGSFGDQDLCSESFQYFCAVSSPPLILPVLLSYLVGLRT